MSELQNSINANVTTPLSAKQGGTGVNNSTSTITIAGNLVTTGANSLTMATTGTTNITLPTSGTLVNSAVTTLSSLDSVGVITTGTWEAIVTQYTETIFTFSVTTNYTINLANGNWQELTLNTNPTFSFSNVPATSGQGSSITLPLIQGSGAPYTVTWPGSVDWGAAGAPTLSTIAGDVDVITMITSNNGTRWRAFLAGKGFGG